MYKKKACKYVYKIKLFKINFLLFVFRLTCVSLVLYQLCQSLKEYLQQQKRKLSRKNFISDVQYTTSLKLDTNKELD